MNFQRFEIKDSSFAGEVRRLAVSFAGDIGFDETITGQISIVINELCSNIVKHAGTGEIILVQHKDKLEIISIDKGPGMGNVNECLKDGFSTQGTQGTGLGAIKRLSHTFELYTALNKGTVIYSAFILNTSEDKFETGSVAVNYPGEVVCGDGWTFLKVNEDRLKVMVADGLGHGLLAHEASKAAINSFMSGNDRSPLMDINALHNALRSTRGAAVAVGDIQMANAKIDYAGLGNISATLVSPAGTKKLISYNGTAGVQFKNVQPMAYPLEKDWVLIMHSDGLGTQWSLTDYPGLMFKHPTLIAAVLYRDYTRGNDDVTVVVIRERE